MSSKLFAGLSPMSQYSVLYSVSPAEVEAYVRQPPDEWFGNAVFQMRGGFDCAQDIGLFDASDDPIDHRMRSLTLFSTFELIHLAVDPLGYAEWYDSETVEDRTHAVRRQLGRAVRGAEVFGPAMAHDEKWHETRWVEPPDVSAVASELSGLTLDVIQSNLRCRTDLGFAEPWRHWTEWHEGLFGRLVLFYQKSALAGDAVVVTRSS